jgi:O-antigen/teichoic acid export membrane protein
MRDPTYRGGYALVVNTAGTTAFGLAYWAVAARLYDRQVLGRGAALVSALILVSSVAQLNLASALPRFLPQAGRSARRLIACGYGASSVAALAVGVAFVTVLPRLSSPWHFVGQSATLAAAFVGAAIVWGVFALEDAALTGLRHATVVPLENTAYGVCKLLLLAGAASLLPSAGIFFSWVVPLAVIVPAINWLIFRRYLADPVAAPPASPLRGREVVRFASVDYLGTLLGQACGNLLPLVVLSTLGAAADGSFFVAWTIAAGLTMVATNFATSMLVEGATAPHRLAELTRGVLARCALAVVPGAAVLAVAARPILSIYGAGYAAQTSFLLALLAVAALPNSFLQVAIAIDRITGRVGRATWSRLALAVLVLGGGWALTKHLGIDGAALAWGGGNLVVALSRSPAVFRAASGQATARRDRAPARHQSGRPEGKGRYQRANTHRPR